MNRIKKIIAGVLLMSITAAELTACVPNRAEYEEQAVRVLEEKYREEFEIETYKGGQSMNDYYEVTAFSKEYPEVLFEAKVARDGSYVMDEYVAARVCSLAEEQIEKNLGGLPGYMQIKVEAVSQSIDSDNADMSMEEFMSMKTKNRFAVYLIYNPEDSDVERTYKALTAAFSGLECMSGNIQLYVTDEKILKQVQEYLAENTNVDYEFSEALEHTEPMEIPFEKGVIQLSELEFEEMAGGRL